MMRTLMLPAAAVLVGGQAAVAQSGMMIRDDGSGPQMLHMSMPDQAELRRPDFEKVDLPAFAERLLLSVPQQAFVERLLDAYLGAFGTLVKESLTGQGSSFFGAPPQVAFGGQLGDGEASLDSVIHGAMGEFHELDGDHTIDFEAGPGTMSVMIGVGGASIGEPGMGEPGTGEGGMAELVFIGSDDEAGGDSGEMTGGAGVFVGVGGPGMEIELPEEIRQKLEAMAQEMADRIQAHVEEKLAAGQDPIDLMAGATSMEERKAQMEQMKREAEAFSKVKAELGRQFVNDVQGQLTAEQVQLWPSLDRALVRRKTLPRGRLDGERIDLFQVARQVNLTVDQRNAIAPLLEQYELDLHAALMRRNEFIETAQKKIDEAMEERKPDKAITLADRAADLRVAVRSVNQATTDAIVPVLGPESGARFRDRVLAMSHARVYNPTRAQKAFKKARALDGLDPATLATVDELHGAFQQELEQTNEQLRQTILRHQPQDARRGLEHFKAMLEGQTMPMMGHEQADPIHQAYAKRGELEERYMKLLYGQLTPEQVASLPKLPSQAKREPMIIRMGPGGGE